MKYSFDVYNLTNTPSFDIPIDNVTQNLAFSQYPAAKPAPPLWRAAARHSQGPSTTVPPASAKSPRRSAARGRFKCRSAFRSKTNCRLEVFDAAAFFGMPPSSFAERARIRVNLSQTA